MWSKSKTDFYLRNGRGVEKWRNLADACELFHLSGRGLFIFADNDPFFDHANVILERIAEVSPDQRLLDHN